MSKQSDLFRKMAERIELNKDEAFGGAFVVVPPGDESEPFSSLILDAESDPSSFWGILKAKCDIALSKLDMAERQKKSGFGIR